MRQRRLFGFIAIVQLILFLAHYFLYRTWIFSSLNPSRFETLWLPIILAVLSVSFVIASLLAFSKTNGAIRALYRGAAVWMGFLSFIFAAAIFAWLIFGATTMVGGH